MFCCENFGCMSLVWIAYLGNKSAIKASSSVLTGRKKKSKHLRTRLTGIIWLWFELMEVWGREQMAETEVAGGSAKIHQTGFILLFRFIFFWKTQKKLIKHDSCTASMKAKKNTIIREHFSALYNDCSESPLLAVIASGMKKMTGSH